MMLFRSLSTLMKRSITPVIARRAQPDEAIGALLDRQRDRSLLPPDCFVASLLAMTVFGASATRLHALEFPKYEKVTKGDTTVIVMKQDRVPLVAVRVTLSYEPGIVITPAYAALYLHSIKYGSQLHPGNSWLDSLDAAGGQLSEDAEVGQITLSTEVRREDAEAVTELLVDGMLAPQLDGAKVEQERQRLIAEASGSGDQPQLLASAALEQAYFGKEHPYGKSPVGTPSSLKTVRAPQNPMAGEDCAMGMRLTVTIVGDGSVTAEQVLKLADDNLHRRMEISQMCVYPRFVQTRGGTLEPQQASASKSMKPRVILIDLPDATQTQTRLMMPGPADIYSPLYLANVPFGATFTSRLVRKLRTELGLTYGIGARLEQRPLASTYSISSFTKVESTGEFLKVLFAEIAKARKEGLTGEEIAKGKALMLGEGPMRWERYSGLAQLLERNALYGRPDDYPLTQITRAQAVDAKAANAALAAALPNKNFVLVLAGPAAKIKTVAAQYGTVEMWTKPQVIDPR